jgi:hypothetical protein
MRLYHHALEDEAEQEQPCEPMPADHVRWVPRANRWKTLWHSVAGAGLTGVTDRSAAPESRAGGKRTRTPYAGSGPADRVALAHFGPGISLAAFGSTPCGAWSAETPTLPARRAVSNAPEGVRHRHGRPRAGQPGARRNGTSRREMLRVI